MRTAQKRDGWTRSALRAGATHPGGEQQSGAGDECGARAARDQGRAVAGARGGEGRTAAALGGDRGVAGAVAGRRTTGTGGRPGAVARVLAVLARAEKGERLPPPAGEITIHQRKSIGFGLIAKTVFGRYPRRAFLGLSLFIGQAFLYNAVTFGFGTILTTFFDVPTGNTGYYFAVIAAGNFLGPLLLGTLFDTLGRRIMISSTYLLSGVILFVTAWLFDQGSLTATTMTAWWCAVLFFASAGASSAYLTVSEIFPMETRAMAIAFFYALGTAAGGISGPLIFADLTESGVVGDTALAFRIGAALMCAAGLVAAFLAVKAERRSLEDIAEPLSVAKPAPAGSESL